MPISSHLAPASAGHCPKAQIGQSFSAKRQWRFPFRYHTGDTVSESHLCQCESSGPAPFPNGKLPPANIVFASIGPRWHNDKNISPAHAPTALPILRRPSLRSLSFLLFSFLVFSLPNKFFLNKKSLPLRSFPTRTALQLPHEKKNTRSNPTDQQSPSAHSPVTIRLSLPRSSISRISWFLIWPFRLRRFQLRSQ